MWKMSDWEEESWNKGTFEEMRERRLPEGSLPAWNNEKGDVKCSGRMRLLRYLSDKRGKI